MSANRLMEESGYSLVEVMASIMILALAIIPMVGMFDMGLSATTRASNYDKARALANQQVERAKALPYTDVRDNFPAASSTPGAGGTYTSPSLDAPANANLPTGSTYTISKQYVSLQTAVSPASLANSSTDTRMMRVTVTVNWPSNNSITATGIVTRNL
jgi:Tfp pilus assembly protein PilV